MEPAIQLVMEYAGAFEETYRDDDWSRLTPYFNKDASYAVLGGPAACEIQGREAILQALKKSIDGFDRRFDERTLELTDGPHLSAGPAGQEVGMDWVVHYRRGEAPVMDLPGRSVFTVADGCIAAMRDEYNEALLGPVVAWLGEYGTDLDGSYV